MSSKLEELKIEDAYNTLCKWITDNSTLSVGEKDNVECSGPRIGKGFRQMVLTREELIAELRKIFAVRFPTDTTESQLVIQCGIKAVSLCPHHLLPIESVVHYGYITEPGESVIGLSKFVRIAQVLAKRAVIQETYTQDLVDVMRHGWIGTERIDHIPVPMFTDNSLLSRAIIAGNPEQIPQPDRIVRTPYSIGEPVSPHVGVVVNASHGCMSCRGVMSPSRTQTSLFTGLLSSPQWRSDFYQAIEESRRNS